VVTPTAAGLAALHSGYAAVQPCRQASTASTRRLLSGDSTMPSYRWCSRSFSAGLGSFLKLPQSGRCLRLEHGHPATAGIPPAELTFMAKRAGAHITELNAGHLSMIANPETVAQVIEQAATATI